MNISQMSEIMRRLGWADAAPQLLPDFLDLNPTPPTISQSGTHWKAAVALKRSEILDIRSRNLPADAESESAKCFSEISNDVRVVNKSHLTKAFRSPNWQATIDDVAISFNLNKEQEKAYRIIVNHASDPAPAQLKMHVGGMGGTGKTQVLKAVMNFLTRKGESHRFIVVAPTGSAAALLGGSTYHYMFGISETSKGFSNVKMAQVKSRLLGVRYIFLDEVSMLSCRDMYTISARLARVMDEVELPFGGMNMIFAGDFAQLPPVIGGEHASLYSRTVGCNVKQLGQQEAALGKALWHQVTTVVILRQNMRMLSLNEPDCRFRQALVNMRYKACTPADVQYLRTRISSNAMGRSCVTEKKFRAVSIITALNVHKDAINTLGVQRFAAETGQKLTDFFSDDTVSSQEPEADSGPRRIIKGRKRKITQSKLPQNIQDVLWNQPHCANTKFIPGKLSLCIGLPVMIRVNAATEMCMTKGQEGLVHGWQCAAGTRGQRVLDTLFVKLLSPPQDVQIDGLPLNIVPLTRTSVNTACHLPDDSTIPISRNQVEVLPNFSMTDYASQGKTRLVNVVDLNNSKTHHSYYTALSRSASANGTLILQGFDASKIMGGATGALRQEFRELELLDDITNLMYEGHLSKTVVGDRRNSLIKSFRDYKGENYIPPHVHGAIRWGKSDPFLDWGPEVAWSLLDSADLKRPSVELKSLTLTCSPFIPAQGSVPTSNVVHDSVQKRRLSGPDEYAPHQSSKKCKLDYILNPSSPSLSAQHIVPTGSQWRSNSCAYDAVLSLLFNLWSEDVSTFSDAFADLNAEFLGLLSDSFKHHLSGSYSLEEVRDFMRRKLCRKDPLHFAFGCDTSVHSILNEFLSSMNVITASQRHCMNGHPVDPRLDSNRNCQLIPPPEASDGPLQAYFDNFCVVSSASCSTCGSQLHRQFEFLSSPPILALDVSRCGLLLDHLLLVRIGDRQAAYKLRGVIYHGDNHFSARFITSGGHVWFHDGILTGRVMRFEGALADTLQLSHYEGKIAVSALYAL